MRENSINQEVAAPPTPPQIADALPTEIIDEILLKLPAKALVSFSGVSKFWKSKIFRRSFIRRHINHPTISHKRVVIHKNPLQESLSSSLSSISDLRRVDFVSPFGDADVKLKAFCQELWCVKVQKPLYLWNPTTGSHWKIPDEPELPWRQRNNLRFVYSLAYDATIDDYKLLKVWRIPYHRRGTAVYSLRENRWREINNRFFPGCCIPDTNGEFVNGGFHWIVTNDDWHCCLDPLWSLISFDLSTEKYKELPQPPYSPAPSSDDHLGVAVFKGLLCVFLNYCKEKSFVLWGMKKYGVEKSWTKVYDIRYDVIPSVSQMIMEGRLIKLKPLYVYENGEVLVWFHGEGSDHSMMVVFRDNGEVVAQHDIVNGGGGSSGRRRRSGVPVGGFVHVESHVSLAAYRQ